ncbi:MAG: UDP-N-acetylglucosamine 1-carboxyvinyltransferase [Candidatus Caenarcaniphilales bacterium]|nr:UDP-N-acetylglucosamine 1-carboxyvinyltransferase [Candidatus Caenarcaniphilales bacterium]
MNASDLTFPSQIADHPEKAERILVRGNKPLNGEVQTSGAKNSVLKLMAATILIPEPVILTNVPPLQDVFRMIQILEFLGGKCDFNQSTQTLKVDFSELTSAYAPFELVSKLRASFVILGPILSRVGEAKVSLPGGCQIGSRRVDLHEKGLRKLGAEIEISHGYVEAQCPHGNLIGAEISLDIPSNGATENLMMAAVLAEGITVIDNAAKDPEIEDLANFLNSCGAKISGAGSHRMVIEGVKLNELHGTEYRTLPDRIEAGTFLIAALATKGHVMVHDAIPLHLSALLGKLQEIGAQIKVTDDSVEIKPGEINKAVEVSTVWYPGFPTDLQPQMTALLVCCEGASIVKENIYEDRFSHIEELVRMGADIQLNHNVAVMRGVPKLTGAKVRGGDLRATAGLIIAGMVADGITEVSGLNHLDRGYFDFSGKLTSLGAEVNRVEEAVVANIAN